MRNSVSGLADPVESSWTMKRILTSEPLPFSPVVEQKCDVFASGETTLDCEEENLPNCKKR